MQALGKNLSHFQCLSMIAFAVDTVHFRNCRPLRERVKRKSHNVALVADEQVSQDDGLDVRDKSGQGAHSLPAFVIGAANVICCSPATCQSDDDHRCLIAVNCQGSPQVALRTSGKPCL